MAIDKLTMINRACAIIGADPIDALDEDTPGAQIVSLRYDSLLEFCLGLNERGWSFATSTRQLALRDGVTPLSGWTKVFALPPERIEQPIKCAPTADWPRRHFTNYTIEGNDLHCDEETMFALIRILPDPSVMSAGFRHVFEIGLAAEFAMGLASDKDLKDRLREEAFGPISAGGKGGKMATAIQSDRTSQPSGGLADASDPLTSAWRSFP